MGIRQFRKLLVWQKSMQLTRDVYRHTAALPKNEVFGLQSQMRRAAVSVPSNIAEGYGRLSDRGFRVFLTHARGSPYELETQIQLCIDLKLLSGDDVQALIESCGEIARMIHGLVKSLKLKDAKQVR